MFHFYIKNKKGFSTIELLIAMAVLTISLTAIFLISFSGQSMMIDNQINSEAIIKAQELLEQEQALARKDFRLVNPVSAFGDGIYEKKIDVSNSSDPSDFFTKKITATVSWMGEYNRPLNVQLSALVTNFENAVGGDTCNSFLTGDWSNPSISSFFVAGINPSAPYPTLSVDAYKQKIYAAVSDAADPDGSTLFIFDAANLFNPPASVDNASGIMAGLNDIHAADNFIFTAKNTGPSSGQLQIFNISDFSSSTFKVHGVTGAGDQAVGNSIFYKDGYVYLGLTSTASGPEFHIIDVHDPYYPSEVGHWPPSGNLSNSINDIYVKDGYAYLAHPTDASSPYIEEITVLDISDIRNPQRVGGYDAPDNSGHGKSFYLAGDTLYFGRTVTGSNQELLILDNSDPMNILQTAGQEISESVRSVLTRDYLTFTLTNSRFQIWRTDNPASISNHYSVSLDGGTSLDCQGNYLYAGSIDSSNNGYLSLIKPN